MQWQPMSIEIEIYVQIHHLDRFGPKRVQDLLCQTCCIPMLVLIQ